MRAAVLIVSWNGGELLRRSVESALDQLPRPRVLLVDNASSDGSIAPVEGMEGVELVRNSVNLGFTLAANQGLGRLLAAADAPELVLLVNQDAVLLPGALRAVADEMAADDAVGAVGCKILFPDGATIQHAGGYLEMPRMTARHHGHHEPATSDAYQERREVDFVTGAAMGLATRALRQVGLFDEIFSPGYYEDVELCQRLRRAGWKVVYTPAAELRHAESSSFSGWHRRWSLSHRNRLVLALPELVDDDRRAAFVAAEHAAIDAVAGIDELHTLCEAYLSLLLLLPRALPARLGSEAAASALTRATFSRLAGELRNHCLERLHGRIAALLATA